MTPQLTELEVQLAGPGGEAVRQATTQALLALRQRLHQPSTERAAADLRELSVLRVGIDSALALLQNQAPPR